MKSFDRISRVYDLLTFIIFFGRIKKANTDLVPFVKAKANILVIGGGSGTVLTRFDKNSRIDYVDDSINMIRIAKRRKIKVFVRFHHMKFEDYQTEIKYDAVICPFFLDLYSEDQLNSIIEKINNHCRDDAILWVSDFNPSSNYRFFSRIIYHMMKLFYSVTLGYRFNKLADIRTKLAENNWKSLTTRFYYSDMIFSTICKRQQNA